MIRTVSFDSFFTSLVCLLLFSTMIQQVSTATKYNLKPDFTVSFQNVYPELAHAYFKQSARQTGWNELHIYTNLQSSLNEQHRGAGFLEGYITYKQIYAAHNNYVKQILKSATVSLKLQNFMNKQLQYMDGLCQNHENQLFRKYLCAYLEQLRYMYRGYVTRINEENRLDMHLGFSQFFYLVNVGDLQDLIPAFNQKSTQSEEQLNLMNCNGIVKIVNGKLYIGHSTHNHYSFLLRIYKTYYFPTKNQQVGSQYITFSSRPGDLISKDDFYVLDSGLWVMESSLENLNPQNYKKLSPQTVPSWIRVCIAVNLARDAQQWANYFLMQRSGTHNNQWVVVDSNKNVEIDKKDIVLFVQQGFDVFAVLDMTKRLIDNGYVATYNIPLDKKVYDTLKYQDYPYDYNSEPRAQAYADYNKSMDSQESMKKYLLQNDFEDVKKGLAPRYDLDPSPLYKKPFGLTDCKIFSPNTNKNNFIWAYSGPSTSNGKYPPFDWRDWPNVSHEGMPDVFNFPWVKFNIDYEKAQAQSREQKILIE